MLSWFNVIVQVHFHNMCFCDCLGKGKSIWDVFSQQPGHVDNNDNGNVACDSYHLYKKDVELLQKLKVRMCVKLKKIPFVKKVQHRPSF